MRYFRNILWAAAAWLLCGVLVHIPSFFVSGVIHPALCEWFPDVFIDYSPVTQEMEYAALQGALDIVNLTLTVFMVSYFCVRLDNERMEYMITETEGLYTFCRGASLYYGRYLVADLAVALIVPVPLSVLYGFVPEGLPAPLDSVLGYIFSFTGDYIRLLGVVGAIGVMCLTVFATRVISGAFSVRVWQAAWLSDIG